MKKPYFWPLRAAILIGTCGLSSSTLPAATLYGGSTTVDFASSFVSTLTGAGITVAPIATATASLTSMPATATFPITGGDTTSMIDHSGGLSLTKGTTSADLENFVINIPSSTLTGEVIAGGSTLMNVTLFDVNLSTGALTIDPALGGAAASVFGIPNLSGASVGTAMIDGNTTATPEPSSLALLTLGALVGAAILKKRVAA